MEKEFQPDFEWQLRYRARVFEQFGVNASYHEILRETIRDCRVGNIPVPQEKLDELANLDATGIVGHQPVVPVEVDKNCRPETHIGSKHWLVYDKTVAWSHNKKHRGVAKLSCRVLAKFCKMPYRTVSRHIAWLVAHGWLEVVIPPKRGGPQLGQQGTYRPRTHDEWVRKHGTEFCLKARATSA